MEAILTAISTIGFPIVAVLGCAWFIYQVWQKQYQAAETQIKQICEISQRREDRFSEQVERFNETLINFNVTLVAIDKRLEIIETKILQKD